MKDCVMLSELMLSIIKTITNSGAAWAEVYARCAVAASVFSVNIKYECSDHHFKCFPALTW